MYTTFTTTTRIVSLSFFLLFNSNSSFDVVLAEGPFLFLCSKSFLVAYERPFWPFLATPGLLLLRVGAKEEEEEEEEAPPLKMLLSLSLSMMRKKKKKEEEEQEEEEEEEKGFLKRSKNERGVDDKEELEL